jgi:hypothetical protein
VLISAHQWSSVVISGHQCSSLIISGHQWSSVVISGHQWSSDLMLIIRAHQCSSVLISGHQCSSELISGTHLQLERALCREALGFGRARRGLGARALRLALGGKSGDMAQLRGRLHLLSRRRELLG